jgi:hypothetical protein
MTVTHSTLVWFLVVVENQFQSKKYSSYAQCSALKPVREAQLYASKICNLFSILKCQALLQKLAQKTGFTQSRNYYIERTAQGGFTKLLIYHL